VLDPLQQRIAEIALELARHGRVALAGGSAMIAHGFVDRMSEDIDLFTPDPAEVADLRDRLSARLRADGYKVEVRRDAPGFVHLDVSTAGSTLRVEIAQDSRMRPLVRLDIGAVLAPEELAADKTLALFGRAYARDLVDVAALADRWSLEELLGWAAEKDAGFDRNRFADALAVAAEEPETEFTRLGLAAPEIAALRKRARAWSRQLS
jgi:predicted nucleotidyltransferase component of viral defense system